MMRQVIVADKNRVNKMQNINCNCTYDVDYYDLK